MRQPGKQTVEETLAAAIAAARLADPPPEFAIKATRKAAKAERRAGKRALAAGAASAAAAAAAADDSGAALSAAAPVQPGAAVAAQIAATGAVADSFGSTDQQQPLQQQVGTVLPRLCCGGRTDAGVTAAGQVGFYPPLLVTKQHTALYSHAGRGAQMAITSRGSCFSLQSDRTTGG